MEGLISANAVLSRHNVGFKSDFVNVKSGLAVGKPHVWGSNVKVIEFVWTN